MNFVRIVGTLAKTPKHGRGAKASWAFASILPEGAKSKVRFDVKAFREPADVLAGMREGDRVWIDGHLEKAKPKEEDGEWLLIVVADKVTAGARSESSNEDPQGAPPSNEAPPGSDDIPY